MDHQLPESRVQLRSSSREIEAADAPDLQNIRNQFQQLLTHHFGAGRASVDVTMTATLVAAVAQVHLQRRES